MTHLSLHIETRQSQTMTPRLQQAVRLLQMSSVDYEHELRELADRNPFLELGDAGESCRLSGSVTSDALSDAAATQSAADRLDGEGPSGGGHDDAEAFHRDDGERQDADRHHDDDPRLRDDSGSPRAQGSGADTVDLMDRTAAERGLRPWLRSQANMLPLSARDSVLVCAVIESLDDDGYLRTELGELATLCELVPPVDEQEVSTALKLVQSFEPAGVGARSVSECLQLQLDNVPLAWRDLCRSIVADHLQRLARRDVTGMAKLLARSVGDVEAACDALRRLDPHPGWRHSPSPPHHVTPDIVVRRVRGRWAAQHNSDVLPRLKLNQSYADLFRKHRSSGGTELSSYLQEARWALRNVEQRFSTILSVAQAILRRQQMFLEFGEMGMKPLKLSDIATELGIHESTVSRVTNNKYMLTPSGLFELRYFFSRPLPMTAGGSCSATAIKSVMKVVVEGEDRQSPMSDGDICSALLQHGLKVERRTVTNYRKVLRIPRAELRRIAQCAS